MSRVLVLGNNTVDLVFRLGEDITSERKSQAESCEVFAGGQAANVAFTLALLGVPVEYLGAFGDDADSDLSRQSLAAAGVGLGHCRTVSNCPAHRAAVFVDIRTAERSIVMHKDPRLRLPADAVPPAALAGVRVLYLDNAEPAVSAAAAALARTRGIPVVADLEDVTADTGAILRDVGTLIAPQGVLSRLTGETAADRILRATQLLGPPVVVATAGAAGAFGVEGAASPVHVPAAPGAVVDTTGAGDAFHAGYLAGLVHRLDFGARLGYAARVAAAACAAPGPRLPRPAPACLGLPSPGPASARAPARSA